MKTHAIHWKSKVNGIIGTGKKLFEKNEAELLATELNKSYSDIHHEAAIPVPVPPSTASAAAEAVQLVTSSGENEIILSL